MTSVEIVDTYKYLGVLIDNKLNWSPHLDKVFKKTQSRLFFLRKLRSFNVCNRMLNMFYQTVVCSVMTFALVCWGGNATGRDMDRLNKLIKKAGSCVGENLESLVIILEDRRLRKALKIEKDEGHPLHNTLMHHRSKRSGTRVKYSMPVIRTDRYGKSFLPSILRTLNSYNEI